MVASFDCTGSGKGCVNCGLNWTADYSPSTSQVGKYRWSWKLWKYDSSLDPSEPEYSKRFRDLGGVENLHDLDQKLEEYYVADKTFQNGSSYCFFRTGIHPWWEDVDNNNGGRFPVLFNKEMSREEIDKYWKALLTGLTNGTFGMDADEYLCGAKVHWKPPNPPKITVWTSYCTDMVEITWDDWEEDQLSGMVIETTIKKIFRQVENPSKFSCKPYEKHEWRVGWQRIDILRERTLIQIRVKNKQLLLKGQIKEKISNVLKQRNSPKVCDKSKKQLWKYMPTLGSGQRTPQTESVSTLGDLEAKIIHPAVPKTPDIWPQFGVGIKQSETKNASKICPGVSYSFFKEGVESTAQKNSGGRFVWLLNANLTPVEMCELYWHELLRHLVKGTEGGFTLEEMNSICGVKLDWKGWPKPFKISMWVTEAMNEDIPMQGSIKRKVNEIFEPFYDHYQRFRFKMYQLHRTRKIRESSTPPGKPIRSHSATPKRLGTAFLRSLDFSGGFYTVGGGRGPIILEVV